MVDAGVSGWRNFDDFKKTIIDKSQTRVLAFLNILGRGMSDDGWTRTMSPTWIRQRRPRR